MTRDEVKKILAKLTIMYPHFAVGEPVCGFKPTDVWFEMIGDMDYARADKAVVACTQKCKYPPTVADIREEYDRISAEANKDEREIREYYERTRSYYPGSGDYNYGWEEWLTRVSEASDRVSAARWLNNRITQYVNSCEKETMDFAECVRTIGNERKDGE